MAKPNTPGGLRSVETQILLSVVDRARHGYGILQEIHARTAGRLGFEVPTFYRALRRLRDIGLIRAAPAERDADERREYWIATALGRQTLDAELKRLEVMLAVGRARLGHSTRGDRK